MSPASDPTAEKSDPPSAFIDKFHKQALLKSRAFFIPSLLRV